MRFLFRHANIEVKRKVFKSIINSLGGNLRIIIAGGAPMDKNTIKGYNDFGFDVHQGYGLTETSPVIAGENSFNKKIGSVGFPLPGIEIKIDNPDQNGIGELIVKTPAVMLGYYEDKEKTAEVLRNGYFYTGDFSGQEKGTPEQMLWRVLHMVVIYAVLYILIYLIERYLKKDIEELQITRRELLVVYFVMIMVYCISNVSYVDVKSIFSAGTAMDVFIIRTLADLSGMAVLYAYHIQVKEIQMRFEKDTLRNIMDMQY